MQASLLFMQLNFANPDSHPAELMRILDPIRPRFTNVPDEPTVAHALGARHLERMLQTGDRAELGDATAILRYAAWAMPAGHIDRAAAYSNLATACRLQFEVTGDRAPLSESIDAQRKAVAFAEAGHPDAATFLNSLSVVLSMQAERTGEVALLDEALEASQRALSTAGPDDPRRVARVAQLGVLLRLRFEQGGQQGDLDQAIGAFSGVVSTVGETHSEYLPALYNLGGALAMRFGLTVMLATSMTRSPRSARSSSGSGRAILNMRLRCRASEASSAIATSAPATQEMSPRRSRCCGRRRRPHNGPARGPRRQQPGHHAATRAWAHRRHGSPRRGDRQSSRRGGCGAHGPRVPAGRAREPQRRAHRQVRAQGRPGIAGGGR